MTDLRIARDLALPVDVAGEAIGILAKRGAGKTNTAVVLVEELHRAGVQFAVLDPVGVWWGIRAGADGSRKGGLAVPVLGGEHGDVGLEPTAGELVADVLVDSGQSLVVDVSEFSKTQQRSFVAAFATRLYRRKASVRSLLHVVLEEADEFAPQRVTAGDAPMVGAIAQLVKRGRSRGIGMTFITQRSASLNKDVLDQADVLVAMRTTGPRDRKAIEGWIEHQDADGADQVLPSLPNLETGEAWVWNPERTILTRAKVRKRQTFDSSETPKAGQQRAEPKETAAIDLTALGKRIEETAERAKQNDPAELRRHIRELERQAAAAAAREPEEKLVVETIETRVEVPVFTDEERELFVAATEAASAAADMSGRLLGKLDIVQSRFDNETGEGSVRLRAGQVERREEARQVIAPTARPPARRPAAPPAAAIATPNGHVSVPQQKILDALAWFEAIGVWGPRRPPLAAVAGVSSRSSGFRANVSTLSGLGLIEYPDSGRVALTDSGRVKAAEVDRPPTHGELHEAVYGMVSGPQATLLRVLVDVYPDGVDRETLAALAGVSPLSSGFRANVSTLSGFELIQYPSAGIVRASEVLFP